MVLIARQKYVEAEEVLEECLDIREKKTPGHWSHYHTKSLLGGCMLAQQKYDKAEICLLSAYLGMKGIEKTMAPTVKHFLSEAFERVVQLYATQVKQYRADEWLTRYEDLVFPSDPFATPDLFTSRESFRLRTQHRSDRK